MTPERLYTLAELVEITGRCYDFWDRQCRNNLLPHTWSGGHRGRGTRLISESDYGAWWRQLQCLAEAETEAPMPERGQNLSFGVERRPVRA